MSASFGFGPIDPDDPENYENSNQNNPSGPDFNELFAQFANFGINPQTLFAAGVGGTGAPLIAIETLLDISRRALATHPELPIGSLDLARTEEAFNIANNWLDDATLFPTSAKSNLPAWSRRDWLDASLLGWQHMLEPLAEGMASALTEVLNQTAMAEAPELAGVTPIMRAFMGSLIATQLGQSVGQLATSVTGSNDVAIPLFKSPALESRLIPQNVDLWADGLDIPMDEVRIFLAVREAAAARLFAHTPWLTEYIRDAIAAYGRGIKIDINSIQEQAERAVDSGELDINNPESISVAINAGLFKPEQSAAQDAALAKLEMIIALIEGWIDHVTTKAVANRLPALPALSETLRRRRATKSPTQQLFTTLLGLEVSPRKMRECATFWFEVSEELGALGVAGRDNRWEDPVLLPTAQDLSDVKKFLNSTSAPDDLSGLI